MKPRILVVDDNEVLRGPLQRMLEANGYDVLAVPSGEEALTVLAAADVHLVVTDWGLPGDRRPGAGPSGRDRAPGGTHRGDERDRARG